MADRNIVIDTSLLIEYLRARNKTETDFWKLISEYRCLVSTVTVFELYAGAKKETQKVAIDTLLEFLVIVPLNKQQAHIAADIFRELKRSNKLIEFRDIFIAACAQERGIPLSTYNTKHFRRIPGLKLYEGTS